MEQELIHRIKSGDQSAFTELIEKYQLMVFRTSVGFVHLKEDAEDIVQDVFVKVYRNLDKYKGDSKFSTWLYRITTNTCLTFVSKKQKKSIFKFASNDSAVLSTVADKEKTPEQQAIASQNAIMIRKAIDTLPDKQRTAFVLSKYDELPQKEIAEILACSEGAVEQLLQRAKKSLHKTLKKHIS